SSVVSVVSLQHRRRDGDRVGADRAGAGGGLPAPGARRGTPMSELLQFRWPARIGQGVLLIVYGVPLFWLVTTSFKSGADVFRGLSTFITFTPSTAAYERVWNADLLHAGINSFLIAGGTTVLTLALGVPAAYALARLRGNLVSIGLGLVIVLQM